MVAITIVKRNVSFAITIVKRNVSFAITIVKRNVSFAITIVKRNVSLIEAESEEGFEQTRETPLHLASE